MLNGDVLDSDILEEAGVDAAETVVAVTNDDETNILAALLAKRQGCQRVMALVNKTDYATLMSTLGIDVVIIAARHYRFQHPPPCPARPHSCRPFDPRRLRRIDRGGRHGDLAAGRQAAEGDQTAQRGADRRPGPSRQGHQSARHDGGANRRPRLLFAATDAVKKVEKMFSVRLEYF